MRKCFFSLHLLLAGVACNPTDEGVFRDDGKGESKPAVTMLNGVSGVDGLNSSGDSNGPTTVSASVNYDVKVSSNSGAVICRGEATLEVMSDFKLNFPQAKIQCASLSIDLAGMLAGQGTGVATSQLAHDGQIFSIAQLANATFAPPRPLLLGPVVQDPTQYNNFKKTIASTLTAIEPGTGKKLESKGSFAINVLNYKTTYTNNSLGETFDNVLHWEMRASGFNLPARYGLVFERWEWLWNTRPIMIPKIVLVGKLSDFISGEQSSTGDVLAGSLEISLTVKDYKLR